jgi:hypothetical protein
VIHRIFDRVRLFKISKASSEGELFTERCPLYWAYLRIIRYTELFGRLPNYSVVAKVGPRAQRRFLEKLREKDEKG